MHFMLVKHALTHGKSTGASRVAVGTDTVVSSLSTPVRGKACFLFCRVGLSQREAEEIARSGKSYVLTGTGSGKSLAYIVPIVDRVLCQEPRERGVKA